MGSVRDISFGSSIAVPLGSRSPIRLEIRPALSFLLTDGRSTRCVRGSFGHHCLRLGAWTTAQKGNPFSASLSVKSFTICKRSRPSSSCGSSAMIRVCVRPPRPGEIKIGAFAVDTDSPLVKFKGLIGRDFYLERLLIVSSFRIAKHRLRKRRSGRYYGDGLFPPCWVFRWFDGYLIAFRACFRVLDGHPEPRAFLDGIADRPERKPSRGRRGHRL